MNGGESHSIFLNYFLLVYAQFNFLQLIFIPENRGHDFGSFLEGMLSPTTRVLPRTSE